MFYKSLMNLNETFKRKKYVEVLFKHDNVVWGGYFNKSTP